MNRAGLTRAAWDYWTTPLADSPESSAAFWNASAGSSRPIWYGWRTRLKRPDFDPRHEVLVQGPFGYQCFGGSRIPPVDSVTIERYGGQRVEILAELAAPGMVVLYDFYYPGWRASVNGSTWCFDVYRVNGIFRGVPLTAGTHHLVLEYHPGSFYAGLDVAVVMLFGVVVWTATTLAWSRRRT